MTDAYTDPGKHKRGTNPCSPRSWRRYARRQERRRAESEAATRALVDELNAASRLTNEQLGPRLAAMRQGVAPGGRHD